MAQCHRAGDEGRGWSLCGKDIRRQLGLLVQGQSPAQGLHRGGARDTKR